MESSSSKSNPPSAAPPNLDDLVIFLCPNGHKLNGPKSLQGKPGQCPHCGAKFQIPSYEEQHDDDEFADVDDDEFELDLSDEVEELPDVVELADDEYEEDEYEEEDLAHPAAAAPGRHALEGIIRALWAPRPEEAVLQLHLDGGEVLAAEKFSASLSHDQFGVFAIRDADGQYTLTAIPWTSIRRIGVRKVKSLPGELFQ